MGGAWSSGEAAPAPAAADERSGCRGAALVQNLALAQRFTRRNCGIPSGQQLEISQRLVSKIRGSIGPSPPTSSWGTGLGRRSAPSPHGNSCPEPSNRRRIFDGLPGSSDGGSHRLQSNSAASTAATVYVAHSGEKRAAATRAQQDGPQRQSPTADQAQDQDGKTL